MFDVYIEYLDTINLINLIVSTDVYSIENHIIDDSLLTLELIDSEKSKKCMIFKFFEFNANTLTFKSTIKNSSSKNGFYESIFR